MYKLNLAFLTLDMGRANAPRCTSITATQLPSLKWKTQPKQLLGNLPLALVSIPGEYDRKIFLLIALTGLTVGHYRSPRPRPWLIDTAQNLL